MADADPWISVKDEVQQTLKQTDEHYERWQVLVSQPGAGDEDELDWTKKELLANVKSIGWDLDEMSDAISAMESNPGRFKVTASEVSARKGFVAKTKAHIAEIQSRVNGAAAKAKESAAKRSALMGGGTTSRYAKLQAEAESSNDAFIDDQAQKQEMIMREQDSQLEEVGATIGVLKHMGTVIGDELEDQNQLLDELDDMVVSTSERVKRTIQKVDNVLAISKDGKQSCMICVLVIALIILIVVYIS